MTGEEYEAFRIVQSCADSGLEFERRMRDASPAFWRAIEAARELRAYRPGTLSAAVAYPHLYTSAAS